MKHFLPLFALALLVLSACQEAKEPQTLKNQENLTEWLDARWEEMVAQSPEWQTYLGDKTDYGKWDDYSQGKRQKDQARIEKNLRDLEAQFDLNTLSDEDQLSFKLYQIYCEGLLEDLKYADYGYHVNQMFGRQSQIPSFLINFHSVSDSADAAAYVSRLKGIRQLMSDLIADMRRSDSLGVLPPSYVLEKVLANCENVIKGYPFDEGDDAPLLNDFKTKFSSIDLPDSAQEKLQQAAIMALKDSVFLAYSALINEVKAELEKADQEAGVWKFPNGEEYYAYKLRKSTTTDISPEEVMAIGLKEVERIHKEMELIKEQVGFKDSLSAFFEFIKTDDRFYYANTEEGKQAFLTDTKVMIDSMKAFLPNLFYRFPKAELDVKPVEKFREKTAGAAFYYSPAPDGSRPGIYYVNLHDMKQQPNNQMEALAYHEAIPGHHMQLSIAQELEGLPKFRKYGVHFTAYVEGWGLYSEYLPKEFGFYADPYSDFGRLSMELWRACRLVADVGIHVKKWTREEAIAFYQTNTPNPEQDCVRMVERHIVMPGQATAYKIGAIKIIELRERCKKELGDKFDIKAFHDVVLANGALPLNLLEEQIESWADSIN